MPFDAENTTSPARLLKGADLSVLAIDTRSVEGRQFMLDMFRAQRREDAMRFPMGRIRSALDSHRKTQRNERQGVKGYFASAAESRAFVRQAVSGARAAALAFDAVPARVAR